MENCCEEGMCCMPFTTIEDWECAVVPLAQGNCRGVDEASLRAVSARRPGRNVRRGLTMDSTWGFIFTSGTTGMPKAAVISHAKKWRMAADAPGNGLTPREVVYGSGMPLYHSSFGGLGMGIVMHCGACAVLRSKFSASKWLVKKVRHVRVCVRSDTRFSKRQCKNKQINK